MPRKLLPLLLGLCLGAVACLAQPFSAVVSFGDSLSDTTNNPAVGDYWEGRWSNGQLWNEYLAQSFGATLYDFAFSGSESSNLTQQITAASTYDWDGASTLFTVWSGANDFIDNAIPNGTSVAAWSATVSHGVNNIGDAVNGLVAHGAHFIVVLNLPDLSRMPAVIDDPTLAPDAFLIRLLAQGFNGQLSGVLQQISANHPSTRIITVDDFSLLDQIVANPAAFNITVVTNDALDVLNNPPLDDAAATNYLFWDVIHPTTKAHAVVAGLVAARLAELPPTIVTSPQSQTIVVGDSVTLSLAANAATSYQWLFNGAKIKNATNSTFTIATAKTGNTGAYSVIASNSHGKSSSAPAKLKVDILPKFVVNPRSQNGIAGKKVALSATAAGSGPIAYQWQFNGANISGATKPILVLTTLTTNESGPYDVVALNPVGLSTSRVANLSILIPPGITSQPQSVPANAGDDVEFDVTASGSVPLRYQWEFDNSPLPHQTNATLTLNNVRVPQTGKYRVLVRNAAGALLSSNANLSVARPPSNGGIAPPGSPAVPFPTGGPPSGVPADKMDSKKEPIVPPFTNTRTTGDWK